jgi:hypothetical protein
MGNAMSEYDPNLEGDLIQPDDDLLEDAKPAWPRVIGTLSTVFGIIAFGCGSLNAFSPLIFRGMVEAQLEGDPLPPGFDFTPTMIAGIAAGLVWNAILIAAGLLLVLRKPIARPMHLVYAVLSVPILALSAWMIVQQQAAMAQYIQDYPDNPFSQQQAQAGPMGLIIGLVFVVVSLAWPLFSVVWFGMIKRTPESMGAVMGDEIA